MLKPPEILAFAIKRAAIALSTTVLQSFSRLAISRLVSAAIDPAAIADLVVHLWLGFLSFSIVLLWQSSALAQPAVQSIGVDVQGILHDALAWVNGLGTWGAIAFIVLYAAATVAFFPGSVLTLGAGLLFGVVLGTLYVLTGATLGAVAAFWVGRYWVRGWVSRKIEGNAKFHAIDEAVGREGFKIVLLTRLSPVFPFNLLNYAYGVTSVTLKDYVLASVGMIPGSILYVYIGSLTGSIASLGATAQPPNPELQWTIRILGFIATVAVTVYVTRVARKALAESVSE
jgi:uncharacterized membrane protein YdjX (TVP38/TMEM64 family)